MREREKRFGTRESEREREEEKERYMSLVLL